MESNVYRYNYTYTFNFHNNAKVDTVIVHNFLMRNGGTKD